MTSVYALPDCFNATKEHKKVYITTPIDRQFQECKCECPVYNSTGPWQELGNTASSYAVNSILTVLGIVFLCALTRRSIARSRVDGDLEEWQQNFCAQNVKGKIRIVLEILDSKEKDVRAAKERLKCAEKQIRSMKLSSNQVHSAILCQMVKLREALEYVEHASSETNDNSSSVNSSCECDSSQSNTLETLAKIGLLENRIRKLTSQNNVYLSIEK